MYRNTANIFCFLVIFMALSFYGYTQEIREIPQPRELTAKSISQSPQNRLRIPDQFFRHDQARDAVRSGKILSLSVIRKAVQSEYPGKIVDVRLLVPKREGINYLYAVRVLTDAGKLLSVKINAKNAKIMDVKG